MGTHESRQRRQPEQTVLFAVLARHLATFLASVDDSGRVLPYFVRREFDDFLRCGILAHGFCRVRCDRCGKDELVAFSCKRRGFCPSCGARRMADVAAHLVDHVLPDVPVRQWVLSVPYRVRWLCAFDGDLCRAVRNILVRAVSGCYLRQRHGLPRPRAGAVVFTQRFDSALRLDVHFHGLWADGLFAYLLGRSCADFHPHDAVTDADVARLVHAIRDRVLRLLRKRGKLPAAGDPADDPAATEPTLQDELGAAAVQGRTALGSRAGRRDVHIGQGANDEPFRRGNLCAEFDGFSLHAEVCVPAGCRKRLERLCRYAARPPIAEERLSLLPNGDVLYKLKRRWRDGSTHVQLTPHTLIERLCSLIPAPRKKLIGYHGVFAPAASYRHRVVPLPAQDARIGCRHQANEMVVPPAAAALGEVASPEHEPGPKPLVPHAPKKIRTQRPRYSWAELLRRVFLIDVLTCPHCKGRRRLLAGIFEQPAIARILTYLGLSASPPELAQARPPPQPLLPW